MTKKKPAGQRRKPGVKSPHVGAKLAFLEAALSDYKDISRGRGDKARKGNFLDQSAARWAAQFGVGLAFDEQLDAYPQAVADLSTDDRSACIATYRAVS
jgi:hypothetical protein